MGKFTSYLQGTPSWIDLATPDTEAARAFYRTLFDWDYRVGGEETGGYIQATLRDKAVAGILELTPDMTSQGVPTAWTTYLAVDDADEVARRVAEAGGSVVVGPMDIMEEGRMLVVQDPTGAVVGGWQAGRHIGAQLANEPGTLAWNELRTSDPKAGREFYTDVFGLQAEEMQMPGMSSPYTVLKVDGKSVAGLMEMGSEMPAGAPPHWSTCFAVSDADATAAAAEKAGGQVVAPPFDIPSIGRYAGLTDPHGASFGVLQGAPAG